MAAGYTVTSVNQSQEMSGGNLRDVVVVTFELDNEAGSGEIRVPLTGDWEAAAARAVAEKAASMLALLNL